MNLKETTQMYEGTMSLETGYRSTISNDQYESKISTLENELENLTTQINIQHQEIYIKTHKLSEAQQELSLLYEREKEL